MVVILLQCFTSKVQDEKERAHYVLFLHNKDNIEGALKKTV